MKILQLVDSCTGGGLETHLLSLGRELIKMGHQPFFFSTFMSAEFQHELKKLNIDHRIDALNAQGLIDYIRAKGIQLLHGHPTAAIPLTAELARSLSIPAVITYHGFVGWCAEAHDDIHRIICVSQEAAHCLSEKYPKDSKKLVVIQNGIDIDEFKPQPAPDRTQVHLLFAGRLTFDKYLSLKAIFEALGSFANIRLTIAGTGPYFQQLQTEAPAWCTMLGWVQDMARLIGKNDILIGTGRGIREAMACGKPALSLNGCGYDGLVTRGTIRKLEYHNFMGRSGLAISPQKITNDLSPIISSFETRTKLGQWCRSYAEEHYSLKKTTARHVELYGKLVAD